MDDTLQFTVISFPVSVRVIIFYLDCIFHDKNDNIRAFDVCNNDDPAMLLCQ